MRDTTLFYFQRVPDGEEKHAESRRRHQAFRRVVSFISSAPDKLSSCEPQNKKVNGDP